MRIPPTCGSSPTGDRGDGNEDREARQGGRQLPSQRDSPPPFRRRRLASPISYLLVETPVQLDDIEDLQSNPARASGRKPCVTCSVLPPARGEGSQSGGNHATSRSRRRCRARAPRKRVRGPKRSHAASLTRPPGPDGLLRRPFGRVREHGFLEQGRSP